LIERLNKSKKQVLVVENSRIMLKIYETQFKNSPQLQNYELSTCTNASDGYEWLQKFSHFHKTLPELIILDWIMPGKFDGFGLLNLIKRNGAFKNIPIIMVSSIEDRMKIIQALKVGVNDYLMKPLNVSRLVAKVVEYTESQVA